MNNTGQSLSQSFYLKILMVARKLHPSLPFPKCQPVKIVRPVSATTGLETLGAAFLPFLFLDDHLKERCRKVVYSTLFMYMPSSI